MYMCMYIHVHETVHPSVRKAGKSSELKNQPLLELGCPKGGMVRGGGVEWGGSIWL